MAIHTGQPLQTFPQ